MSYMHLVFIDYNENKHALSGYHLTMNIYLFNSYVFNAKRSNCNRPTWITLLVFLYVLFFDGRSNPRTKEERDSGFKQYLKYFVKYIKLLACEDYYAGNSNRMR